MMRMTVIGGVLLTLLSGCMSTSTPVQSHASRNTTLSADFGGIHRQQNVERVSRGLPELRQDRSLMRAAAAHARDMSQRGFYSHFEPDGGDPMDRVREAGGCRSSLAENIAKNWSDDMEVFAAWMNSAKHLTNIVDPGFTRYGVGRHEGYYVMVYAGPCV